MIIAKFLIQNSLETVCFFEKTFLLANTSIEMILRMFFLFFSNTDIEFADEKLIWRLYIAAETLLTTS